MDSNFPYPINNPSALKFKPLSDEERHERFLKHLSPGVTRTQYTALLERILREGELVYNERTKKHCLVILSHRMEYDVGAGHFPLDSTRKSYPKSAIFEKVGYWRGYEWASQFRNIGVKTWDANANETEAWINSPYRKGEDHIGRAYGAQLRRWKGHDGKEIDQLMSVYERIRSGKDDRGLIMTFYNPGEFELGALRPCLHTHQFSILGDGLYLESQQRSNDVPNGQNFNQIQIFWTLYTMAAITGLKPKKAVQNIANAHIYEDQFETVIEQLNNEPFEEKAKLILPDASTYTMDYILDDNGFKPSDVVIEGYESHRAIKHAFSA
ncbi:thymidylate synthase [Alteromonas mediterranea]|uniref:thymidylate synthase n=1 Tax=Alteromonas mediterranea TaxID=314275 RepID=UPI0009BE753B|nr:thymidylate synthase [Alteromonas mediterranea]